MNKTLIQFYCTPFIRKSNIIQQNKLYFIQKKINIHKKNKPNIHKKNNEKNK